jgi:hypothetical protein
MVSPRIDARAPAQYGECYDIMSFSNLEKLSLRYKTVSVFYHDAYSEWQIKASYVRCVHDDCRYEGWGDTLNEAIKNLLQDELTKDSKK